MPTLLLVCYAPQSGRRHKPRSAKLLIDQHGEDASGFAVKQADKQAEVGDMDGQAVWLRVLSAVKELQQREPGERAVH